MAAFEKISLWIEQISAFAEICSETGRQDALYKKICDHYGGFPTYHMIRKGDGVYDCFQKQFPLYEKVLAWHEKRASFLARPFDLLLFEFGCEVPPKKYDEGLEMLTRAVQEFIACYDKNKETVDALFSGSIIYRMIDISAGMKYGLKLQGAYEDLRNANEDEKIWHGLARAYGSRSMHKTVEQLTRDDWDYINPSLEAYKDHFGVSRVDLEKMYEDYPSVPRTRILQIQKRIEEINGQQQDYFLELHGKFVKIEDEFIIFSDQLDNIIHSISGTDLTAVSSMKDVPVEPQSAKKAAVKAIYNSFDDCVNDKRLLPLIDSLVNEYCCKRGKMSGPFVGAMLVYFKNHNLFSEGDPTEFHFGELFLAKYGDRCSFSKGKYIKTDNPSEKHRSLIEFHLGSVADPYGRRS